MLMGLRITVRLVTLLKSFAYTAAGTDSLQTNAIEGFSVLHITNFVQRHEYNAQHYLLLYLLTHPLGVVKVPFHHFAGFAITVANSTSVFLGRRTNYPITTNFLKLE